MKQIETITFKEFQDKVLDLYEEVYEMLESKGIKWWVHSGALLGMMRHNGQLIPWDDDIDIMTTSRDWENNLDSIQDWVNSKDYTLIDFKNIHKDVRADIKFAKIVSNETYYVKSGKQVSDGESRPFIDIFFACPSKTFRGNRGWKKYERLAKMEWIVRPGFKRFTMETKKPKLTFITNFFSYPVKFIMGKRRVRRYLNKPYKNTKGNWDIVQRADNWSGRLVEYDLVNGMLKGELGGKKAIYASNWEQELINSYGEDWAVEKRKRPHIIGSPRIEQSIWIKDYLREKYK